MIFAVKIYPRHSARVRFFVRRSPPTPVPEREGSEAREKVKPLGLGRAVLWVDHRTFRELTRCKWKARTRFCVWFARSRPRGGPAVDGPGAAEAVCDPAR